MDRKTDRNADRCLSRKGLVFQTRHLSDPEAIKNPRSLGRRLAAGRRKGVLYEITYDKCQDMVIIQEAAAASLKLAFAGSAFLYISAFVLHLAVSVWRSLRTTEPTRDGRNAGRVAVG